MSAGCFFVILMGYHLVYELILPRVEQKRTALAANNSMCCECLVAPTITWSGIVDLVHLYKQNLNGRFSATPNHKKYPFVDIVSTY